MKLIEAEGKIWYAEDDGSVVYFGLPSYLLHHIAPTAEDAMKLMDGLYRHIYREGYEAGIEKCDMRLREIRKLLGIGICEGVVL